MTYQYLIAFHWLKPSNSIPLTSACARAANVGNQSEMCMRPVKSCPVWFSKGLAMNPADLKPPSRYVFFVPEYGSLLPTEAPLSKKDILKY